MTKKEEFPIVDYQGDEPAPKRKTTKSKVVKKKTTKKKVAKEASAKPDEIQGLSFWQTTKLMGQLAVEADENGELTDEQVATLVEAHAHLPETVEQLAATILKLEWVDGYLKSEADRIAKGRKRVQRIIARMKSGVLQYMDVAKIDKLSGGTYLLKPAKNPPKVVLEDGFDDPFLCRIKSIESPSPEVVEAARKNGDVIRIEPDKKQISEVLKKGAKIKGAELVQTSRLVIQ